MRIPTDDLEFKTEQTAIYSSAIGLARLALKNGEPDKAEKYLDEASEKVTELWKVYLKSTGLYTDEIIEAFLGKK